MPDRRIARGNTSRSVDEKRRQLIKSSLFAPLAAFAGGCAGGSDSGGTQNAAREPTPGEPPPQSFGPLQPPDANNVRVPEGFTTRVVARSSLAPVPGRGFVWHPAPDGGATFAAPDGGWIYVSNSEVGNGAGGAGALRFDSAGRLVDAYRILDGTSVNCAGGPTPWDTWLSCEETPAGNVWESDPFGGFAPVRLPALGSFQHEAAALDPVTGIVYMTEDRHDGRFYRFLPAGTTLTGRPELLSGRLQVAEILGAAEGSVAWHDVPDPAAAVVETRNQVVASTAFDRGEGLWFDAGFVYMATTGDNRIWAYDVEHAEITILYDAERFAEPILRGVDNVTVSPRGDVLVAEDGDDMQLVALTPEGDVRPVLQIVGHDASEITGPAFDPSGTRLYFSSQTGATNRDADGVTFEMSGPFPS